MALIQVPPVQAGGMTLLSTTSLSGATTTISGISGSYNNLVAIIYGVTNATANGELIIKPNNTFDASHTGFNTNNTCQTRTTSGVSLNQGAELERSVSTNVWQLVIYNYASTASRKPLAFSGSWVNQYAPSGAAQAGFGGGAFNTTSAISSLVFYNSGGNLSTGTVLLYGVK